MTWSLFIHEHPSMVKQAKAILENSRLLRGPVVCVTNIAAARQAFRKHPIDDCMLVVTSLSAPLDDKHSLPVDRSEPTITSLIEELRQGRADSQPPVVFLVSYDDGKRTTALDKLARTHWLPVQEMTFQLPNAVRQLTAGNSTSFFLHDVDVDITLRLRGPCDWNIRGRIEAHGLITMDKDEFQDLLQFSNLLLASEADHTMIRRLGRDLYARLLNDNLKTEFFEQNLRKGLSNPECLDSARFRFRVDEQTCALLVEALGKPRQAEDDTTLEFWTLNTPIFRKFGSWGGRTPLFKDDCSRREPVKCLIVEGNTSSFSAGGKVGKNFPGIDKAAVETTDLAEYLTKNQEAFNIEPPLLLRFSDDPENFSSKLRETLRREESQLIHYVGHSDIGSDNEGYLVLGGGPDDLLSAGEFSSLAKHAQFVFMNSCRSASPKFIMKLVQRNIPAVVGYARQIEDNVAATFARDFYEDLFEGKVSKRFIEYAFMRAKRQLHDRFTNRTVWTVPLLFMQQMSDSRAHSCYLQSGA